MKRPKSAKTTTIGMSQYFFSFLRNCHSCDNTRALLIRSSEHAREVRAITITVRVRGPAGPARALPHQRVAPGETPHRAHRHENEAEQDRQQDPRIPVAQES